MNMTETRKMLEGMSELEVIKIALDENDYTEMIATQREELAELQNKLSAAEEEARIYRRENNDLKDYMRDKGLIDDNDKIIDDVG